MSANYLSLKFFAIAYYIPNTSRRLLNTQKTTNDDATTKSLDYDAALIETQSSDLFKKNYIYI